MLEIIYASAALKPFAVGELDQLLVRARLNNARLGVSGMLLHDDGSFLQVLEGEPVTVKRLFAKIGADPRHRRVVVLQEAFIEERSFQQWTMGLVSLSRVRGEAGHALEASQATLSESSLVAEPTRARAMLLGFCQGRWRSFVET